MIDPYKPEEAVILFVSFKGTIYRASLLAGTYYGIADPSEYEFLQQELTRRKIPWDRFGEAAGSLGGFGVELKR